MQSLPLNYLVSIILFLLPACKTSSELSDLSWVLGKWQVNESNNFEEWEKIDDHLFRGKGYVVKNNDTLITETIEIVKQDKSLYYIPIVTGQNEGKPVTFKLIASNRNEIIFENKAHDFPQRIIYIKNGENRIDARIEGKKEGFFTEVKFKLIKVE